MDIRIDSFISKKGICARRKVKDLIAEKRVKVNDTIIQEVIRINPAKDTVIIDKKEINNLFPIKTYIILNKPLNVLSTTKDDWGRKTVLDIINSKVKLFPVGRLDYNSTGLILLTNDGDLALKLTHPRYHFPKIYKVETKEQITESQLKKLRSGVKVDDKTTLPAIVNLLDKNKFEITLHQGMKRQIREMCKSVGLNVSTLERTKFGPLTLGNLKPGEFRDLTIQEVDLMKNA